MEIDYIQLALLNNIMYTTGSIIDSKYKNKTIKDFIISIREMGLDNLDDKKDKFDFTVEEWNEIFTAIEGDEYLLNLTIKESYEDKLGGEQICLLDNLGQAIVVFKGTGELEWTDNLVGGYEVDTSQQTEALEWIENLPYKNIIVTGHSKGGNKAQYVTIKFNKISKCVAFDGQGFSKEFCEVYLSEIVANRNKITLIAPSDDFVNILLFQIAGKVIYTKPEKSIWDKLRCEDVINIIREHCPNVMLQFNNGKASLREEVSQEPLMIFLHEFTLFIEENSTFKYKKIICDYIANLISVIDKNDKTLKDKLSLIPNLFTTIKMLRKYFNQFEKNLLTKKEKFILLIMFLRFCFTLKVASKDVDVLKDICYNMANKLKPIRISCSC